MTHTVAAALAAAKAAGIDRLDAQLLLGHLLGQSRTWLVAHDDAPIAADDGRRFHEALRRRAGGEPVAYLLGEKEFHGLRLRVDRNVLVPRPDTEVLVDWALELLRDATLPAEAQVVDLGTGSGAIALAVKHGHRAAAVVATDASPAALAVARANARALQLPVEFAAGDWWAAVGERRFDLILSNPPYIAEGDPHLPALKHEPLAALTPGGDGVDALRRIVAEAAAHASPAAWILLEHGHDQAEVVQALLQTAGWRAVQTRVDLGGRSRCTGGRR